MKLPSLPRWNPPKLNFHKGISGWRTALLASLLFALAFAAGLMLGFPTTAVKQKLVNTFREHQAHAELQSLTLSPLLALKGKNLTVRMDDSRLPPFTVEQFSIRPLWLSLLTPEPGAIIDAELLQGRLQASVRKGGRMQAQASDLRFALPLEGGVVTLSGILTSGQLQQGGGRSAESTFAMTFGELFAQSPLLASTANRRLSLGQVNLEVTGRGQSYTVTRMESRGGDLTLTGSGNVLAGRTLEASRLNLTLALRPSATFPADLKGLLDLIASPSSDGSYQIRIGGTLASPSVQPQGGRRAVDTPLPPVAQGATPPGEAVAPDDNAPIEQAPASAAAPEEATAEKKAGPSSKGWQPGRSLLRGSQ